MQIIKVRPKGSTQGETRNIRCPLSQLKVLEILEGTEGMTGLQISRASGGTISKTRANQLADRLQGKQLVEPISKYDNVVHPPIKRVFYVTTIEFM